MSRVRAYYLPTDSTSAIDASHPASVETLDALGWKITPVDGSRDEIEEAGRKLAHEIGYPVTQEGCMVQFNLEPEKNAATITPEMFVLLMKVVESADSGICSTKDAITALTSGSPYMDVEDGTDQWIRIHFGPGMLVRVPAGAKFRVIFDEHNRATTGTAFFKETISNHGFITKEEIENHPIRRAYLNALG
ncbi:hypothetical protein BDP27DRAFT_1424510 [Rhodocollybia butyracea]|uniref:acireductone dioxygenase (Fe(2+)-requiring) n=1 Tax=Rhodocollybia butyracea TaxID=206335 RepID=A0A9P5U4M3_9AGAR|nr:hypothetical protein BDP27DRAFT_1424510 [Rhodocollybia butyracea]